MAIKKSSVGSGIPFGNDAKRPGSPQIGQPFFNGDQARLELYTTATGWQNIVQETPAVVSIFGAYKESETSNTITVNGTNFITGAIAYATGTDGVDIQADITSLVSVVEISAVFSGLVKEHEPYDVKVVNPSNLFGVLYETLFVDETPIWITGSGTLGTYIEQSPMSVSLAVSDPETQPLTFSISSGSIPPGLSVNTSTGVISGTPSDVPSNTTYSFTVNASDNQNNSYRVFSILIADRGPAWSTSPNLPTFRKNLAYSTTLVAVDDNNNDVTYSLFSGSLPNGLSLTSSGVISGTPTSSTNAIFTIRATDANGNYTDRQFSLPNVAPDWTEPTQLSIFKNFAYSYQLSASDDSGNNPTYSLHSGLLPSGISLSSSGLLSGTTSSATAPSSSIVIRATDENGNYIDRTFSVSVSLKLEIDAYGAQGGSWTQDGGEGPGLGGRIAGSYPVQAGVTVYYLVGGAGVDISGRGGAGGGGYTAVWTGDPNPAFGTWIFGAAGGGGENGGDTGGASYTGGNGGVNTAYASQARLVGSGGANYNGATDGYPGTSSGGGNGGGAGGDNAGGGGGGSYGTAGGSLGSGGGGSGSSGGYGGGGGGAGGGSGGTAFRGDPGAGGGGGYIGGNGGSPGSYASTGGYNYAYNSSAVTANTSGARSGNGTLIINGTTYNYTGSVGTFVTA